MEEDTARNPKLFSLLSNATRLIQTCARPHLRPGTDCAVCTDGYSPGYFHSCKSCEGDSRRSALYAVSAVGAAVLLAVVFVTAKLVSAVETTPSDKTPSRWQQRRSVWQSRMKKMLPLTAIKIVVVVWQIVTQVCLLALTDDKTFG